MGGPQLEPVERPLRIGELNTRAKALLEGALCEVSVRAECSRVTFARSGHVYLVLKDAEASIDAVIWAGTMRRLAMPPEEGMEVVARGTVTVYPRNGRFQIVLSDLNPAGEGAMRAAILALEAKLRAEGCLEEERKRALPLLPRAVGIVTSPSGAALQDFLRIASERFPAMPVVLEGARVQGPGAAEEIRAALERLGASGQVDVIVVGRGGGSAEDLWAFQDEALARTILACPVPVVSAVGHEIDTSISDLVADRRAPTPTAAAELVVPEEAALRAHLADRNAALGRAFGHHLAATRARLEGLAERRGLARFTERFEEARQDLDLLDARALRALRARMAAAGAELAGTARSLAALAPERWMRERRREIEGCGQRLRTALGRELRGAREALESAERRRRRAAGARLAAGAEREALARCESHARKALERRLAEQRAAVEALGRSLLALDPTQVLARGYSITRHRDGEGRLRIVRAGERLAPGTQLETTLDGGERLHSELLAEPASDGDRKSD